MPNVILPSGTSSGDFPWAAGTAVPLEQLHAWTGLCLYYLMRNQYYQESVNGPNVPQVSVFQNQTADKKDRLIIRSSLLLDPENYATAAKLWNTILVYPEIPAVFPADFKTA